MKNKQNILMVTYGGGHVNIIRHIYEALLESDLYHITLLALTTAPATLDDYDIEYTTISQMAKKLEHYNDIMELGKIIAAEQHNVNSGIAYEDSVAYFGIGYYDLINKYGENKANLMFHEIGRKSFLPVDSMKEIIKNISPDIVIITSSPRMEKAAGIAASELNVPVVLINDLPIMEDVSFNCKVCLMNEWSKRNAIANTSIKSENIIVTGQPVFEHNLSLDGNKKQAYIDKVVDKYEKVVLYLGQPNNPDTGSTIEALYKYAKANPTVNVLVRPHPNDSNIEEKRYLDNLIVTKKGELKYLICSSDVVITHYSTAGLEAALMGIPLITVLVDSKRPVRYKEYGIAIEVNDVNELDSAIKQCLYNNDIKKVLEQGINQFKNKENATKNIIRVINELLKRREQ